MKNIGCIAAVFFPAILLITACTGSQIFQSTSTSAAPPQPFPEGQSSITDEIRSFVEIGTPETLLQASDLIRSTSFVTSTEFGRTMNMVISMFMQKLYPDIPFRGQPSDPVQTHRYTKIINDIAQGLWTPPPAASQDYLEYILACSLVLSESRREQLMRIEPYLIQAGNLNPRSVLAPYFLGLTYEHTGDMHKAGSYYEQVYRLSAEMYPAVLGLARVMLNTGESQQAIRLLQDMLTRQPDYLSIKRQLAIAYYEHKDWDRAESATREVLEHNTKDSELILMRAHILVELGRFAQAQQALDTYASTNTGNSLYLLLRARVQNEGFHNRDAALNYLRSLLRSSSSDDEIVIYTATLLMNSPRSDEQQEGRTLLQRIAAGTREPSLAVITMLLKDALRREAWQEAEPYMNHILMQRRLPSDLLDAYTVEQGMGNTAQALAYARELYQQEPSNEEGVIAYITALIDTGRTDEARSLIESKLPKVPSGTMKSRYYYQRSRLQRSEDLLLSNLRSSLFEDARNLDALIAMFEFYHRKKDSRALSYLKQALALSPENPQLQRYKADYANLL
ncbi:MAG: tetratricopeptide repeat protein [Spirochaetaceae bacterium]|jgi:tetratricopeptide (TPR) repeat protein|nr:tetratricopeptide repeat protein [Spirochaetaceae bacterium]